MLCTDISKVQDDEVGDGTTSVVVFACELLKVKPEMHVSQYFIQCRIKTLEALVHSEK